MIWPNKRKTDLLWALICLCCSLFGSSVSGVFGKLKYGSRDELVLLVTETTTGPESLSPNGDTYLAGSLGTLLDDWDTDMTDGV